MQNHEGRSYAPRTRRAALRAGAVAIGALCVPALALAAAPAVDLDAELLVLIARYAEAEAEWRRLEGEEERTHAIATAAYPPRPAAVQWKGSDMGYRLGGTATGKEDLPNGRMRLFYSIDDVDRLRAAGPATRWALVADDHPGPAPREPDPLAEARRLEIIAADQAWFMERGRINDSSGWDAASEAVCDAGDVLDAVEAEILSTEPLTMAGLLAKARWASRPGVAEAVAGLWARRVVADVVALAERGALGGAA